MSTSSCPSLTIFAVSFVVVSKLTGLPFYLVVKFSDGLYYCEVSLLSYAQLTISFGGRTDRVDAQDVEPCVFFDTNLFKKVVSKE